MAIVPRVMESFKTITVMRNQKHRVAVGAKSGVDGRLDEAVFDGGSSEEASLVPREGIEPPTLSLGRRRSIR